MFKKGLFYDKISPMKNKISFLTIIAVALCVNHAGASECIGEDCELESVEFELVEQESEPVEELEITEYEETDEVSECDWKSSLESCYDYNCPFDTAKECEVWYKKPEHKTYVAPRSPHLAGVRIDEILYALYSDYDTNADNVNMSPLVERYKILSRASNACCGAGIIYKMRENGASDSDVYKFLQDDANYFAIIKRCMMMDNTEIESNYSYGVTGEMVADVRNACLCKNRQWFENLLQPFNDVYERMPVFRSKPFAYSYIDDMQRSITVYINNDVQKTSALLNSCPK